VALAAERGFVGVQCGIMDPYAVGLAREGQILWLDCKDRSTEHLPLDPDAVRVAVADTGVRRELAWGAFNQRVAEARAAYEALAPHSPGATCLRDVPLEVLERHGSSLDPVVARRAEHVLREVRRTFAARDALRSGDLRGFGRRMFEAHRSLRDLYEVSVEELDVLVGAAEDEEGVLGARLTGAGFGGCVVILLSSGAPSGTLERIGAAFERRFGARPAVEVFGGDPGPRTIQLA
jgi:galactokinase